MAGQRSCIFSIQLQQRGRLSRLHERLYSRRGFLIVIVIIIMIYLRGGAEKIRSIARSLICANDELAQELIAQAVKVIAVELGVLALLEIFFCSIR